MDEVERWCSMSQHTQGKLKQRTGYPMDIVGPDEQYAFARAYRGTTLDNAEANARRLVVCWNACEGLPTDILEDDSIMKIVSRIRRERDELLQALKMVAKTIDEAEGGFSGNQYTYEFKTWTSAVRAAIKKAEGEGGK
jgi:hypothetical protein